MGDNNTINFYSANAAYGCFSNFSLHSITLKGKIWKTSEHYFQAQKFAGTPFEEQVRATGSPGASAKLGRNRDLPLRKDWERVKDGIMKEVLMAKFTQHEDIKQELLSTGDKTLVEHTERDSYWGDGGGSGCGKNKLGFLLMEVRDEIRAQENNATNSNNNENDNKNENNENGNENESNENENEKSSGDEESEEVDEGEENKVEGELEPNRNHMYEPGDTAEKKTNGLKKKVRRTGSTGGSKTRSKRGVFKDLDGSSTLEKTNEKKGSVTIVGEGTVFNEKALPPQAKFVVNKYQMQRKYHPTEADFPDEVDDDEPTHAKPAPQRRQMADFFKLRESEEEHVEVQVEEESIMTADECLEAAKNNIELYKEVSSIGEADLLVEIRENSKKIRNNLGRFIEEFAETGDEKLSTAMDYFEQLEAC